MAKRCVSLEDKKAIKALIDKEEPNYYEIKVKKETLMFIWGEEDILNVKKGKLIKKIKDLGIGDIEKMHFGHGGNIIHWPEVLFIDFYCDAPPPRGNKSKVAKETRNQVREFVRSNMDYTTLYSEGNRMKFWLVTNMKIKEKEVIKKIKSIANVKDVFFDSSSSLVVEF